MIALEEGERTGGPESLVSLLVSTAIVVVGAFVALLAFDRVCEASGQAAVAAIARPEAAATALTICATSVRCDQKPGSVGAAIGMLRG